MNGIVNGVDTVPCGTAVEGPRDPWRVCEVSPLLGERARPATRLGRAVAGGVRVIKS